MAPILTTCGRERNARTTTTRATSAMDRSVALRCLESSRDLSLPDGRSIPIVPSVRKESRPGTARIPMTLAPLVLLIIRRAVKEIISLSTQQGSRARYRREAMPHVRTSLI